MPLWRGDHVSIRQLAEDFARYLYLPRLKDSSVLVGAIRDGLPLLTWDQEAFGYADSFDDKARRYRGLRGGTIVSIVDSDDVGLLVRPEVARRQLEAESAQHLGGVAPTGTAGGAAGPPPAEPGTGPAETPAIDPATLQPKRFHGTVTLDPARVGRDAGRIAEEVIAHLSGLVGATVTVTLEVEAEILTGATDHVVRTVTENSRTLKFTAGSGFEKE